MKRPRNHVTDRMDAFMSGPEQTTRLPILSEDQLVQLEEVYPNRSLGRAETIEDHLRYAGKVELIALLRDRAETSRRPDVEDTDFEPDPLKDGEKAT